MISSTPAGVTKRFIRFRIPLFFLALFTLYIIVGLSGYGNDSDTYGLIRSGWRMLLGLSYVPSRLPGYFVPELIVGLLSSIGGAFLSNLVSAVLGSAALILFYWLIKPVFSEEVGLGITCVIGLNPLYIIASSSSIDYIYSIFFCMCGFALLRHSYSITAAFLFALAISSRLSSSLTIIVIYLYFIVSARNSNEKQNILMLIISGIFTLVLSILCYLPPFMAFQKSFEFISYAIGNWTVLENLVRFVYKNLILLGIIPTLVIFGFAIYYVVVGKTRFPISSPQYYYAAGTILLQEILFLKAPIDSSYLLPILFVLIPLWTILVRKNRFVLSLLLFFMFLSNFVEFRVLSKTYNEIHTNVIGAKIHFSVGSGVLLQDIENRSQSEARFFIEKKLINNKFHDMEFGNIKWKRIFFGWNR